MNTPSGMQRGYVPQNTGGYRAMGYNGNQQQVPYAQMPYQPSGMNAGQRGYVNPGVQTGRPEKRGKGGKTALAIILSILAVAMITVCVVCLVRNAQERDRIDRMKQALSIYDNEDNPLFYPGVYVDGIDLGGMTPEQALNSVSSQIRQRNDAWQVQLTYEGRVVTTINASMLGMSVDPAEALNAAWIQGRQYTNLEDRYNEFLRLQKEHYEGYTARPSSDNSVIDGLMNQIKSAVDRPSTDAKLLAFDTTQAYPFIFQDEEYGLRLDTAPLVEKLYRMVSTMESGTVEIVPEKIEPSVRKTDLQKHYMLRSSVYTPISSRSPENRNSNIRLAFSRINGYELQPGQTFRFNQVVGERSISNGFLTAEEYVYGEHVEGVGGGVCQASTTVYQAAVCAGLKVTGKGTKRYYHSDSVSYTDYGKDATVSDTKGHEKDLWFVNNTDGVIYFVAEVLPDPGNKRRLICKVSLYGEDMGDVWYELASEKVDTLPAPDEPEYIRDRKGEYVTYTDQQKTVSEAQDGFIYKSYRLKYEANILTGREELYTDRYEPKAEKIYVGVTKRDN